MLADKGAVVDRSPARKSLRWRGSLVVRATTRRGAVKQLVLLDPQAQMIWAEAMAPVPRWLLKATALV
jgi:hypothetical protein